MIDIIEDESGAKYDDGSSYERRELSIYIHIPFCVKKCVYCDFLSFPVGTSCMQGYGVYREKYIEALCEELRSYAYLAETHSVKTIYIGGGTPSLLEADEITMIMTTVRSIFDVAEDAEISIEVNPGTLTSRKAAEYIANGINRMSIGLQSAQRDELQVLGRIHNYDQFLAAFDMAREAGFRNINIDLMSDIPGQTMRSYLDTLEKVLRCKPEHISSYSLIVEAGTPLAASPELLSRIPDEDVDREMYDITNKLLDSGGYHRYEISNYAKEGYECRHNLGYWNRTEYLGIGTGAASLINNQRFVEGGEIEVLTPQNQMEEYMFLGLRRIKGISKADFRRTFGRSVENVYGKVLIHMYQKQLLEDTGDNIRLTEKGIDVSNYVMSEFLF